MRFHLSLPTALAAVLLASGCNQFWNKGKSTAADEEKTDQVEKPPEPAPEQKKAGATYTDVGTFVRPTAQTVKVEVGWFEIQNVTLIRNDRNAATRDRWAVFGLQITNTGAAASVHYHPWSIPSADGAPIILKDNLNNSYALKDFGPDTQVTGQLKRDVEIAPGQTINDIVVFEPPAAMASGLVLELPGANVDRPGETLGFKLTLKQDTPAPPTAPSSPSPVETPNPDSKPVVKQKSTPEKTEKERLEEAKAEVERKAKEAAEKAEAESQKAEFNAHQLLVAANKIAASGRTEAARRAYANVVKVYPGTLAAKKASEALKDLPPE